MNTEPLRHLSFDNVWKMRTDHPYSLIVKEGGLLWSCGQCPLDSSGAVLSPGDLLRQAKAVAGFIHRYLTEVASAVADIAQLVVYYVKTQENDAGALIDLFQAEFGEGLLITPVPVPFFYYDGMLIEVDVFGVSSAKQHRHFADHATGIALDLVDARDRTLVRLAATRPLAERAALEPALCCLADEAGLVSDNLLSSEWFVADDAALALVDAAAAGGWGQGRAVGIDFDGFHALANLTFCKAPVSRQAFSFDNGAGQQAAIKVALTRSGDYFSINGHDTGGSQGLVAQTEAIMRAIDRVLLSADLGFAGVRKATTYYVAGSSAAELHDNMAVRNRYYEKPGPASTGLPVKGFPRSNALIDISLTG